MNKLRKQKAQKAIQISNKKKKKENTERKEEEMIKKSRKRKEKKIALLAIKSKVTFLSFLLLCVCLLVVNGAYFIIFGGISMTISHQSQ